MAAEKNPNVLEMMLQKKEIERKEVQHENESLQRRLKEYETAYGLCQQTKDEIAKELFQAEDKIDQLQEFINKGGHSESLDEMKENYFNLEKKYESLVEQTKDDEVTNSELMEQLKETQKLSAGKDKVINDLNQQVAKSNVQIITQQKEAKRMVELLAENETVIASITREKNALNAEISKVAKEVGKLNAVEVGSNRKEMATEGEAMERIREQATNLIDDKKKNNEEIKKLMKDLSHAKSEYEDFQMEYEMLQEEFEKCKEVVEERDLQISKAVEIDRSLRSRIQILETDIDNYERDLSNAERARDEYRHKMANMTAEIECLVEEKRQLMQMLECGKQELQEIKNELGEENLNLKEQVDIMRMEVKDQEMIGQDKDAEIEKLYQRETELDEIIQDLQSEHLSLTRAYGDTKKELTSASEMLRSLEKDIEHNVDSGELSRHLTEQLRSELDSLRLENEQRRDNEETQRKIIKELRAAGMVQKRTLETSQNTTKQLQGRLVKLGETLSDREKEVSYIREELHKKLADLTDLANDFQNLASINKELERKMEAGIGEEEGMALEETLSNLQNENKALKISMKNNREVAAQHEKEIKELQDDLNEALNENTKLTERKVALEGAKEEHERLLREHNSTGKEVSELQFTINELSGEVKVLHEKEDCSREESKRMTENKQRLENELNEKDKKLKNVENELVNVTKQLTMLQMGLEKERNQGKAIGQSNEILTQKIEKLSNLNRELSDSIAEKDGKILELQTTESKALDNNTELEKELVEMKMAGRTKDAMNEELSAQLKDLIQKIEKLEKNLEEAKNMNDTFMEDGKIMTKKVKDLNQGIQNKDALLFTLQSEKKTIEESFKAAEDRRNHAENDMQLLRKEREEMEDRLRDLASSHVHKSSVDAKDKLLSDQIKANRDLTNEVRTQRDHIKDIESECEKLMESLKEQTTNLDKMHRENEENVHKWEENTRRLEAQVELLGKERVAFESECRVKERAITELQETTGDMKISQQETRNSLDESKQRCSKLKIQLEELERAMEDERSVRIQVESDLLEAKRHLFTSKELESKGRESRSELTAETENLTSKLEEMSKKQIATQSKLNNAQNYIVQLEVDKGLKTQLDEELPRVKQKLLKVSGQLEVETGKVESLEKAINAKENRVAELETQLKNAVDNECRLKEIMQSTENEYVAKEAYDSMRKDYDDLYEIADGLKGKINEISDEIYMLRKEKERVGDNLSSLKSQYEAVVIEKDSLQFQLHQTKQDQEKSLKKLSEAKCEFEEQTAIVNRLQDELKESRRQSSSLQNTIDGLSEGNLDLDTEVKEWSTKCSRLRAQIEDLQSENMSLHQRGLEDARQVGNLKLINERLERKHESLGQDVKRLNENADDESNRCRELAKQLSTVNNENKELESAIQNLEKEKCEFAKQIEEQRQEMGRQGQDLKDSRSDYEKLQSEMKEKAKLQTGMQNSLKAKNESIYEYQTAAESLKNEQRRSRKAIEELTRDLDDHKMMMEALESEKEAVHERLENNVARNIVVSEELESLKVDYRDLHEKYDELEEKNGALKDELTVAKDDTLIHAQRRQEGVAEKERLKTDIASVEGRLETLKGALDESRKKSEKLESALKLAEREAEEAAKVYEERSQEKEAKIKGLERQDAVMKGELEKMQQGYKRSSEENEKSRSMTMVERKRGNILDSEVRKLKVEMEEFEKELREKKEAVDSMEEEIKEKMRRNTQLTETLEEKNELILSLQSRVTNLVKRIEGSESETKVSRDELRKASNETNVLKNDLERAEQKISELQIALNSQNQCVSDYAHKFGRLENEMMGLETDKSIYRQERDKALDEKENLRSQLKSLKEIDDAKSKENERYKEEIKVLKNKLHLIGQASDLKRREMEKEIEEKQIEAHNLKTLMADLKRDYHSTKEQLELFEDEVSSSLAEKERVSSNYLMVSSSFDKVKSELGELQDENSSLRAALSSSNEKIVSSEKERKFCEDNFECAKKKLSRLIRDAENTAKELKRLKEDKTSVEGKLDALQKKTLAEVTGQYSEVIRLKAEVDCLKEELTRRDQTGIGNDVMKRDTDDIAVQIDHSAELERFNKRMKALQESEMNLKSELKLAKNKLSHYSMEREKWEDSIQGIVSEFEREKAKHSMKEKEVIALQTRLERDKDYLGKKISNLELELQTSKEIARQQQDSERSTHEIEIETKQIEVDSLKRQLSLQSSESQGSRLDWEELKRKLARKDAEISHKSAENNTVNTTRKLEVKFLKTNLQCSRIEHQLAAYQNSGMANFGRERSKKLHELSQTLQTLKKESELLRAELSKRESIL